MSTWLQLTNMVLEDLNETVLTSSNFSASVGIQTVAKTAIQKAINHIITEEIEWPFLHSDQTQAIIHGTGEYSLPSTYVGIDWGSFVLVGKELLTNGTFDTDISSWTDISSGTGSVSYSSSNNNVARLNAGASGVAAITQSVSTQINQTYNIRIRTFGGSITLNIGTSSGASDTTTTALTVDNLGDGQFNSLSFIADAVTTWISFTHTTNNDHDVGKVELAIETSPEPLRWMPYNVWFKTRTQQDLSLNKDIFGKPSFVYRTQNDKFGLSLVPNTSDYNVIYEAWLDPTDLSTDSSSTAIPARYDYVITARAKMYPGILRSDPLAINEYKEEYFLGLAAMRKELIPKSDQVWVDSVGNTNVSRRIIGR